MIEPYPYQREGVNFLTSPPNQKLLADEMGLGKTPQLIWAALKLKLTQILVICPAVAKYNWQKEFEKFGQLPSKVLEGPNDMTAGINICSFDYARRWQCNLVFKKFDLLIVDEAHYLKEPTAGRTKAIVGKEGLIHCARRSWFATGTPAPNHAGELWTLLYTFGLTKISYEGFIARYCTSHRKGHYGRVEITGTNTKTSPELKAILKKCSLRRLSKDVLDLPPLVHNPYVIKPDPRILEEYPELKEKLKLELAQLQATLHFNKEVPDDRLISALQLMAQSISSVRRYHALTKVRPCAELVRNELYSKDYDKIIIFGIHTDALETLARSLQYHFNPAVITGKTPAIERQKEVERFQTDDKCKVFVGNIMAAGTAITLTAANQVLFLEQDFVPGNNAQAAKRAHRIGQKSPVFVRHLCINDGLDDKITAALARKIREVGTFIEN